MGALLDILKDDKNKKLIGLMALSLLVSAVAGLYYYRTGQSAPEIPATGFDLNHVEQRRTAPSARVSALVPAAPTSSPAPLMGGILADGSSSSAAAGRSGSAKPGETVSDSDRRHEEEFLKKYGAQLARYEQRLGKITMRYYKSFPVVRGVDRDFAHMDRYMAVKRKYEQDGNPYEFVRGAIALPEVRAEISKRLSDPEAWKASLGMISDTLRDGPPPWVYGEAQSFLLGDQQTQDYIRQFTAEAGDKIPPNIAELAPPDTAAPMMKLVQDMAVH